MRPWRELQAEIRAEEEIAESDAKARQYIDEAEYGPQVCPNIEREGWDWCHLCGRRSEPQVLVASCRNAEHPKPHDGTRATHKGYDVNAPLFRTCESCIRLMLAVVTGESEPVAFKVYRER